VGYKIARRILPSLKYFRLPWCYCWKAFFLRNVGKPRGGTRRDEWTRCLGGQKRSRTKEGLGALSFGCRLELDSRDLPSHGNGHHWGGGGDGSITGLNSGPGEVLEIFLPNLMVPEFSPLGKICCGFYHFFVPDPVFAFRINYSIANCNPQRPLTSYSRGL